MNEFDLIKKYLEKHSTKVIGIEYFDWNIVTVAVLAGTYLGAPQGEIPRQSWFFGHVNIVAKIGGVIVLTNEMRLRFQLVSDFGNIFQYNLITEMGVNFGMSLLGNGEYEGVKRLYGCGFNRLELATYGFGAATFEVGMQFNGYLFRLAQVS